MTESNLAQTHVDTQEGGQRFSVKLILLAVLQGSTLMRFQQTTSSRDTRIFQDLSSLYFMSYRCSCCIYIFLVEKLEIGLPSMWNSFLSYLLSLFKGQFRCHFFWVTFRLSRAPVILFVSTSVTAFSTKYAELYSSLFHWPDL